MSFMDSPRPIDGHFNSSHIFAVRQILLVHFWCIFKFPLEKHCTFVTDTIAAFFYRALPSQLCFSSLSFHACSPHIKRHQLNLQNWRLTCHIVRRKGSGPRGSECSLACPEFLRPCLSLLPQEAVWLNAKGLESALGLQFSPGSNYLCPSSKSL